MALSVDIEKKLGSFSLRVVFEASEGVTALLGASGAGKSMTLKCIAGIERPDRGRIVLGDRVLFDSDNHICLTPQQRHVGYLFQQYALFPNMTVEKNIRCGLRDRRDADRRVAEMIERMQLTGLQKHLPGQLSGGQQQRTALARILINEPDVLLLDEPFSALDVHLRFQMEREVRQVIRDFSGPVLLVSHDRDEVYRLSDHIAVMEHGQIEAMGGRHEVFARPRTVSGARLTGCKNISAMRILSKDRIVAEDWNISLSVTVPDSAGGCSSVGVRMHDVIPFCDENTVQCRVVEEIENPFSYTIMLTPSEHPGRVPIGMELDKKTWQEIRRAELPVGFPVKGIMMLEDE